MSIVLILVILLGLTLAIMGVVIMNKDQLKNEMVSKSTFIIGISLILCTMGYWIFSKYVAENEDTIALDQYYLLVISEELNIDKQDIIITNYEGDRALEDNQTLKLVQVNDKSYVFKFTGKELTIYTQIGLE